MQTFCRSVADAYCSGDHTQIEALLAPDYVLQHADAYDELEMEYIYSALQFLDEKGTDFFRCVFLIQYRLRAEVPEDLSRTITDESRVKITDAADGDDLIVQTVSIVRNERGEMSAIPLGFKYYQNISLIKTATFENLCDVYNYFDSSMAAQFSFVNLFDNPEKYRRIIDIPSHADDLDDVRTEYAGILHDNSEKGAFRAYRNRLAQPFQHNRFKGDDAFRARPDEIHV
ncbi:MAG: hypothetical protein NHB14_02900 [Desulfosporosinus sp.]|jgi:hypothetical protein|nr:hypothetical protein [Desulfosporosinus sp.]